MHLLFAVAHQFSREAQIPPQGPKLLDAYQAAKSELDAIKEKYGSLGELYGALLSRIADWIATQEVPGHELLRTMQSREMLKSLEAVKMARKESGRGDQAGVSIALCRTRAEDLYLSALATEHLLDHPLLKALAGVVSDYEERRDASEHFRAWGDRSELLMERSAEIIEELVEARSMTIDTRLRNLAVWLREEFKEPTPAWKFPFAPVENFGANGLDLSMHIYIDNVRMEKYLRPYHAYTQFRLRILERLGNEGISIPVQQVEYRIMPTEAGGTSVPSTATVGKG
jgi:hypothetical protein